MFSHVALCDGVRWWTMAVWRAPWIWAQPSAPHRNHIFWGGRAGEGDTPRYTVSNVTYILCGLMGQHYGFVGRLFSAQPDSARYYLVVIYESVSLKVFRAIWWPEKWPIHVHYLKGLFLAVMIVDRLFIEKFCLNQEILLNVKVLSA